MLVGKDHMVNYCKIMFFAPKKTIFAQNGLPSVRLQHKSQQTICLLAAHLFQLKILQEKGPM